MLRTNRITVRGTSYLMHEPSGSDMTAIRKILADEKSRSRNEGFVVYLCCDDPKFVSEADAQALPHKVLQALTNEAFRLMEEEEDDASPKAAAPTT